jgi:hypothetical protein
MGWRYNCPKVYINGGIWTTIEHDPLFISSSDSEKKFLEKNRKLSIPLLYSEVYLSIWKKV